MIVVKIELHPNGDASKARLLGTAEIANDGRGSNDVGSYSVKLFKWGSGKRVWQHGKISGFPRLARGPWDLLLCALCALIGDRNKGIQGLGIEYGGEVMAALDSMPAPKPPEKLFDGASPSKPGHAQ